MVSNLMAKKDDGSLMDGRRLYKAISFVVVYSPPRQKSFKIDQRSYIAVVPSLFSGGLTQSCLYQTTKKKLKTQIIRLLKKQCLGNRDNTHPGHLHYIVLDDRDIKRC